MTEDMGNGPELATDLLLAKSRILLRGCKDVFGSPLPLVERARKKAHAEVQVYLKAKPNEIFSPPSL